MRHPSLLASLYSLLGCWAVVLSAPPAFGQAQQVPIPEETNVAPQVEIAGVGAATLDLGKQHNASLAGGGGSSSQVNVDDSALLISAAERLYRNGIGSFSFGGLATDETNVGKGTQFFVHQAFADYQNQQIEAYVGRTDTPTAQIVQFPTLRGDDLVTFTNLLDPFSDGGNVQEHRYANVASVTLNQKLQTFENLHVQHLIDTASGTSNTGLNSYGVSFQWLNLPALEAVQRVVSYGAGYEHRSVPSARGGRSDALYAGGVINLRPSLTNRIDFRVQDNLTFGNSLDRFGSVPDTFAADANSIAAAVRYLHSPFGVPGYQLSLTAGYRGYRKVPDSASLGVALTGVKRLGAGFDAVAQYLYAHRNRGLAAAYGGSSEDQTFQVGFIFNFDATFNKHIGPRRTLLNLQHQYIPE